MFASLLLPTRPKIVHAIYDIELLKKAGLSEHVRLRKFDSCSVDLFKRKN